MRFYSIDLGIVVATFAAAVDYGILIGGWLTYSILLSEFPKIAAMIRQIIV